MTGGIIVIDKAPDWTSHDVVAKLRGIFREKRIGHAGTLDPMATGVLPVFVGRATRAVEFAGEADKEYMATLRLGVVTDTQDVTGTVLETHPAAVSRDELEAVLPRFRGEILQVPPMYSAIKKEGKKLYELARKGVEVDRPPRPVTIHALEVVEALPGGEFVLRVGCSKGTYVRTLCHDIGRALGCGGTMAALRRTMACGFTLSDAVTLEEVQAHPDPRSLLLPVDSYFGDRPAITLDTEDAVKRVKNGAALSAPRTPPGQYRVYGPDGAFLALMEAGGGRLTTIKSFYEVIV